VEEYTTCPVVVQEEEEEEKGEEELMSQSIINNQHLIRAVAICHVAPRAVDVRLHFLVALILAPVVHALEKGLLAGIPSTGRTSNAELNLAQADSLESYTRDT
jgi:hypothetical protein